MAAMQLNDDEASQQACCPSCGGALAEDSVLCVACGYDRRTGRRVEVEAAPASNPLLRYGVAGLVVLAIVVVVLLVLPGEKASAPAASPPPPVPVAAPVVTPPTAPAETSVAVSAVAPVAAPVVPTSDVAAAAAEEVPAPVIDPEEVMRAQVASVGAELDRVAPMLAAGDEAELRMTNGIVQRGIFKSKTDAGVVLAISTNETRAVDFTALDRTTRVRADESYRAKYIDFHARQRTARIVSGGESGQQEGSKP